LLPLLLLLLRLLPPLRATALCSSGVALSCRHRLQRQPRAAAAGAHLRPLLTLQQRSAAAGTAAVISRRLLLLLLLHSDAIALRLAVSTLSRDLTLFQLLLLAWSRPASLLLLLPALSRRLTTLLLLLLPALALVRWRSSKLEQPGSTCRCAVLLRGRHPGLLVCQLHL
jgi:hypothetical protein